MKLIARASIVALTACLAAAFPAQAADKFPSKTVHMIIPSAAGSYNDLLARLISQRLQERWGQSVVVENRPGAGQIIGTDAIAKAPADGHTFGMVVTSHVINPNLRPKMPYDALADFSGITLIGYMPIVITTAANSRFSSLGEVLAFARTHPGEVTYATPGVGSAMHFAGDFLGKSAGADLRHIPFRGGPQQVQDVIGGRIALNFGSLSTGLQLMKQGQLKALAITEPRRSTAAPDVPVVAETIQGFSVQSFYGFVAPQGTPREILATIRDEIVAAVKMPEVASQLASAGFEVTGSRPEEFDRFLADQLRNWSVIVKKTGITGE
ncbi:MAG: tripartite tricarboxylate transporter substrate binding protein [Pseudomonadota bacterium]